MMSLLTIIEPFASPLNAQFYMLALTSLITAILCYMLLTKRLAPNSKLSGLLGMLAGFVAMISFGAVLFSYVSSRSITSLHFNESNLTYSENTIPYSKIDRHFVKPLPQQSRYSAQINVDTALVYVIEMKDKSLHLFSNDYYNVRDLKKVMEEYVPK